MNKTFSLMVLVALIALSAGVFVRRVLHAPSVAEPMLSRPLDASFPDTAETQQPLSQWRGKLLVINFWATWCPPCLKEIPEFIRLQAEYQRHGLQFVGIAIDDKQSVLKYLQDGGVNYPVLIAGDGGIAYARQLGNIINAVPYTVIVDQPGQVVYRQPGEFSPDSLRQIIEPMLGLK
ncbi:MAG: TlpA disulfide reductase family protein [Methylococcales bacterium]|nr:TlpA disulfide reductase family protein [Methylococcales bacterium]